MDRSARLRNRLLSVDYDVDIFVKPLLARYPEFPAIGNERCGAWYAFPFQTASCYFKSTDGHAGTWNFSLKRLNLQIITVLSKHGGCLILDASVRKALPDSFSRTIPIWAVVINRIVVKYREDLGYPALENWDTNLHAPWLISDEEQETISSMLNNHVESLYTSGAIVNPLKLVKTMKRPLRPSWVTPERNLDEKLDDKYYNIICVSCSTLKPPDELKFDYFAGAADDHEAWALNLNPRLFWNHRNEIIGALEEETAGLVESIVENDSFNNENIECNVIGGTNIYIGTRRSGRPPNCWKKFDAILNVTNLHYDDMDRPPPGKNYLQMPVEEGKRDRAELERWMAVGIAFVALHASNRRILIHCAQGRDRSVAVAMACIVLLCELTNPLDFRANVSHLVQNDLYQFVFYQQMDGEEECYRSSGLSSRLVDALLGRKGRDICLEWLRNDLQLTDEVLGTKSTLRIALQFVQQYRNSASPSRSTMQKLNRFFMSAKYEPS